MIYNSKQLTDYVAGAREYLRGACVHEVIVHKQGDNESSPPLCPVIIKDKVAIQHFLVF